MQRNTKPCDISPTQSALCRNNYRRKIYTGFMVLCIGLIVGCGGDSGSKSTDAPKTDSEPLVMMTATPEPTPSREYPDEPIPLEGVSRVEFSQGETATIHVHDEGDNIKPKDGERVFLSADVKSDSGEALMAERVSLSFQVGQKSVFPSMEETAKMLGIGATATVRISPVPILWLQMISKSDAENTTQPEALVIELERLPPPESAYSGE